MRDIGITDYDRSAGGGSGLQARVYGDFGFEKFRNGAAGFSGLDGGVKFGFVGAGNVGDEVEMTLGDGKTFADLGEGNGRGGFKVLRGHAGVAELRGEGHGETSGVRRGQQLFRICADPVFKTSAEGILRLLQYTAVG